MKWLACSAVALSCLGVISWLCVRFRRRTMNITAVQEEAQKHLLQMLDEMRKLVLEQSLDLMKKNPKVTNRAAILFGGIEKMDNMRRVIVLLVGRRAYDEMHVLLRTMVDLVVNILYLQFASEEEVERFVDFDYIAGNMAVKRFHNSGTDTRLPDELVERTTKAAKRASSQSHLSLSQKEWSRETQNLRERAELVDKHLGGHAVATMYASLYTVTTGNVHATYKTFKPYIDRMVHGVHMHRLEEIADENTCLHGLLFVISIIGHFLIKNHGYSEGRTLEIMEQGQLVAEIVRENYKTFKVAQVAEVNARASK